MKNRKYHIKIEKEDLVFTTNSFRTEKESVLHKGVYTGEFVAMLFASAVSVLAYTVILFARGRTAFAHYIAITLVFVVAFSGFLKFISRERLLKAVFSNSNNTVRITRQGIFKKNIETVPLQKIKSIGTESRKFVPQNIDGIRFVEKILLQHGSSSPGLGDEKEFIVLALGLTDGSERVIYAGTTEEEPGLPVKEIKNFLEKKQT